VSKYLQVIRIKITDAFYHRARAFIWVLNDFIVPVSMIAVTSHFYVNRVTLGGYTQSNLLAYYMLAGLFSAFMPTDVDNEISNEISTGDLSGYLLKPLSYIKYQLASFFGWKIFKLILYLPFFIAFTALFNINLVNIATINQLAVLLLLIGISFTVTYLLSYTFGLVSFWVTEIGGIKTLREVLVLLLGGQVIPVTFMPDWINHINQFLPFRYILVFPIDFIQGKLTQANLLNGLLIETIWIIVFFLTIKYLWCKGIVEYSAVGN